MDKSAIATTRNNPGRVLTITVMTIIAGIQMFPLIWLIDFSLCNIMNCLQWEFWYGRKKFNGELCSGFYKRKFSPLFKKHLLINTLAVVHVLINSNYGGICLQQNGVEIKAPASILMVMGMMIQFMQPCFPIT